MKKLAIITSHPIQYNAPLFKLLANRKNISIKVFYTWSQSEFGEKYDPGFGKKIEWDIPLLEGYEYFFSKNVSKSPGSHHFRGIDNPNLINEISDCQPNAILVYGWSFKSHLKIMRFFKGKIPILFRGDSTLLDDKNGIKKILRRLSLKYILSNIDIALYAGEANKKYYEAAGIQSSNLYFMPHSVENVRFGRTEMNIKNAQGIREKCNIGLEEIVFLFAGKIDENKNIRQLINIFKSPDVKAHLLIAGTGVLENELKEISKSNLDKIHFLGFQNQNAMPSVFNSSNVFILPSTSETWGLSINEAMAAGNSILLSDKCGAAYDLVEENVNGFIFPISNFEILKEKILYLINNKTQVKEMGQKSCEKIKEYNYLKCVNVIENIVNNIKNIK